LWSSLTAMAAKFPPALSPAMISGKVEPASDSQAW